MKTIKQLIVIIIMTTNLNSFAQDDNYKGPAKMEVKTFWRQAEMFKNGKGTASNLNNMERALATIKEKDPAYATLSMEEELSNCKKKVDQEKVDKTKEDEQVKEDIKTQNNSNLETKGKFNTGFAKSNKASWDKINSDKLFNYLFVQSHTTGSPKSEKLLAALNEYNSKATELLAMDFGARDRTNTGLKSIFDNLDSKVSGSKNGKGVEVKEETSEDETEIVGDASEERVKCFFYHKQLTQAKWDAARKLFPNEANYEMMYQKKTAEISKYGSVEDLKKNIEKNNLEAVKNRKLPQPATSDPTMEKIFIETFNKNMSAEFKGTAYKAILMQKDWGTIRHEITGIVLGRKRQAAIVYKGTDGKCYLKTGIIIEQEYVSGSFQNTKIFDARYSGGEMLCENAK